MSNYQSDRKFTDLIHRKIAIPKIYNTLGWKELELDSAEAIRLDMQDGIDYTFLSSEKKIRVQERFREVKYSNFNDFTIRYKRDENEHEDRKSSEFFKLKADVFLYGICNCSKSDIDSCSDFIKFALINIKKLYSKIENAEIQIQNNRKNTCYMSKNILICPIKFNTDGSSSFVPFDIQYLIRLWGNEIVIHQKGFM